MRGIDVDGCFAEYHVSHEDHLWKNDFDGKKTNWINAINQTVPAEHPIVAEAIRYFPLPNRFPAYVTAYFRMLIEKYVETLSGLSQAEDYGLEREEINPNAEIDLSKWINRILMEYLKEQQNRCQVTFEYHLNHCHMYPLRQSHRHLLRL